MGTAGTWGQVVLCSGASCALKGAGYHLWLLHQASVAPPSAGVSARMSPDTATAPPGTESLGVRTAAVGSLHETQSLVISGAEYISVTPKSQPF